MADEFFFAAAVLLAALAGWFLVEAVLSFRAVVREWRLEKSGDRNHEHL